MTAHDEFASYDAAYVLGALSPRDRQEYEQHLRECTECARAVRELAGMPGLLAKVPPDLVTAPQTEGPPDTLLPRLLARTRSERRRTRFVAFGTSALAAAACLVLAVFLAFRPVTEQPPPQAIPTATMSPINSAPVWATVGLQNVAWGTKVNMHCMYEKGSTLYGDNRYVLVAIADDGEVDQLGSWAVQPGKDAKLQAATSLSVGEIAAIEIRTSSGTPVLRLKP